LVASVEGVAIEIKTRELATGGASPVLLAGRTDAAVLPEARRGAPTPLCLSHGLDPAWVVGWTRASGQPAASVSSPIPGCPDLQGLAGGTAWQRLAFSGG
jgi:hypothetical protein